jgi:hypothetical protein
MHSAEHYLQKADEMDARADACSGLWEREAYRRIARRLRARAASPDPFQPPASQSSSDLASADLAAA